jgi:hypothetical protein
MGIGRKPKCFDLSWLGWSVPVEQRYDVVIRPAHQPEVYIAGVNDAVKRVSNDERIRR